MYQEMGGNITRPKRTRVISLDDEAHKEALISAKELEVDQDIDITPEEMQKLIKDPVKEPTFPFLMILLAALKDIVDSLDFTGFGLVITTVTSVIVGIIIFIWCLTRGIGAKEHRLRRSVIKQMWKRYVAVIIIEFIPAFKILPLETIFVYVTHNADSVFAKAVNEKVTLTKGRFKRRFNRDI